MIEAAKLSYHVAKGQLHSLRLSLYRNAKLPYGWLKKAETPKFKLDQVWPQPSPISAKMPHAVLYLPSDEIREFLVKIVSRFQRQVATSWIAALRYLRRKPHLDCPDDETFAKHLTETVFTYFLTDSLTAADREFLAANGISSESVRKSDLTPVSTVDCYDGLHCAGSVVYLRERADGAFELVGAVMVDRELRMQELVRPSDGDAWKLAKMHVLQGATYLSLFVTHPRTHFPMDAIIAVTRTLLPKEHPVAQLIAPHTYLQLPLDYSVIHIKNGPGYNDPRLYYTAFSGKGRSQYGLFEICYSGMEGCDAFPKYEFGYLLRSRKTKYMQHLLGYYDIILEFVRQVVAEVEIDELLLSWGEQCAHYVRGFPGPELLRDRETLAACVAYVVWNCSVVHSADHWDFHAIPLEHKPTRLRVPAPFRREGCHFDPAKLTNVDDRLRHFMWNELYLRHWLLKRLCEVDYGFQSARLQAAQRELMGKLEAYDAAHGATHYIRYREICSSIHY